MEKVFENKFQVINYYKEHAVLECIWQNCDDMIVDDFKEGLREQLKLVRELNITKELFDTRDFTFIIAPDVQEWVDDEIYTQKHELGVKQFALVMTEEILSQLALEQVTEEGKAHLFNPKFFSSREEALKFLFALD